MRRDQAAPSAQRRGGTIKPTMSQDTHTALLRSNLDDVWRLEPKLMSALQEHR